MWQFSPISNIRYQNRTTKMTPRNYQRHLMAKSATQMAHGNCNVRSFFSKADTRKIA